MGPGVVVSNPGFAFYVMASNLEVCQIKMAIYSTDRAEHPRIREKILHRNVTKGNPIHDTHSVP